MGEITGIIRIIIRDRAGTTIIRGGIIIKIGGIIIIIKGIGIMVRIQGHSKVINDKTIIIKGEIGMSSHIREIRGTRLRIRARVIGIIIIIEAT